MDGARPCGVIKMGKSQTHTAVEENFHTVWRAKSEFGDERRFQSLGERVSVLEKFGPTAMPSSLHVPPNQS